MASPAPNSRIPSLLPRGGGHQFVVYGDACSGRPGMPHERNFAEVNAVLARLEPPPEFILFAGDEIAGITPSADELRAQWRHWLDHEMGWLKGRGIPIWHATSNHTTYDRMSEAIFAQTLAHLPRNGPPGQEGLSYWVRRDDLVMVFVHTLWTGLGGEGFVETDWLRQVLRDHADARHKIVVGHHPAHSINGFSGAYGRDIGPECATDFWNVLVEEGVFAYFCSHILAFDVQVHRGVLQVCTAGAGTGHRMPEGIEYLHAVQASLDAEGLRYQVLDTQGVVRESLSWPVTLPPVATWQPLPPAETDLDQPIVALRFQGITATGSDGGAQTLLSAYDSSARTILWIGLRGPQQRLTVIFAPERYRSPAYAHGPTLTAGEPFDLRLVIHKGMGPGGFLYSLGADTPWTSLTNPAPWGPDRLTWPTGIHLGHGPIGADDQPFRGSALVATACRGGD